MCVCACVLAMSTSRYPYGVEQYRRVADHWVLCITQTHRRERERRVLRKRYARRSNSSTYTCNDASNMRVNTSNAKSTHKRVQHIQHMHTHIQHVCCIQCEPFLPAALRFQRYLQRTSTARSLMHAAVCVIDMCIDGCAFWHMHTPHIGCCSRSHQHVTRMVGRKKAQQQDRAQRMLRLAGIDAWQPRR